MHILLDLRRKLKISQEELGRSIGVSKTMIYLYESGRFNPSPSRAAKLMKLAARNGIEIKQEELILDLKKVKK